MKRYTYKIIYDIERDIWNWFYGANYSNNSSQLTNKADRAMAKKITGLEQLELATPLVRKFLEKKKENPSSQLNKFIKIAEQEFAKKFSLACEILENITGYPMVAQEFTFYVTTFPRMVAFFDENIVFMYAKIDKTLWGSPIDGWLHEGLHFQFDHYYRLNPNSPVADLSDGEYFMLKESLTVILDADLKPIIAVPDNSYPEFSGFRKLLHTEWKKHHDFDKLVDYGLKKLPDFVIK